MSREGIAALATYVPAGLLAIGWVVLEKGGFLLGLAAVVTILLALVTVWCTGMIYASLPTIRQWHQPLVAPIYVVNALATGALLYLPLSWYFGHIGWLPLTLTLIMLIAALLLKLLYWRTIDNEAKVYTAETATGLGRIGKVRQLDPPHGRANFVNREMGFRVARKHGRKLRLIALVFAFAIPLAALVLTATAMGIEAIQFAAIAALLSGAIGIIVERWLFFAEAEHVAMLFYGADRA